VEVKMAVWDSLDKFVLISIVFIGPISQLTPPLHSVGKLSYNYG
jgi:hypothetical protein